jgi:hypothetical protein
MTEIEITIEKIKKAVRLANRTTELGERETALRLARRLAEAKGLAFDDIVVEREEASARREDDSEYTRWHGSVSGWAIITLRQHFGVVVMTCTRRDKVGRARMTWFGSALNIDIARYCYDVLVRECERAWHKVQGIGLKKEQFVRGWFYAIDRKLTEHPLRNDSEQFEAERREAERKFKEAADGENVKNKKMRKASADDDALTMGYQLGKGVSLNRPCGTNAGQNSGDLTETKLLKGVA